MQQGLGAPNFYENLSPADLIKDKFLADADLVPPHSKDPNFWGA